MSLYLHGLGHFHPENRITNRFLEELDIGTSDEWIMERVGIRSRRTVLPLDYIRETGNQDPRRGSEVALFSHAEMAEHAVRMAVERAGIELTDVGMVLSGSSRPDTLSPADACNVAERLGLERPAFDVNSACTSFFAALYLLASMRPETLPYFVLVVAPESMTLSVDYRDRSASVLWGDGATAAVVSSRIPSRMEVLDPVIRSSPAGRDKVVVPLSGHFHQEGRTVQMFAVKKTIRLLRRLQEAHEAERRMHFVGHQANLRMLETVCHQCEIPEDRHHHNVVDYGNTGAAGAPSVISMEWDRWRAGDDVAVVGVGSGLTWSSFLLRVGEAS